MLYGWTLIALSFMLKLMIFITDDFDISNDVIEWFDTSDYNEDDETIPTGINKKIIGKFKDELKGKLMTEFITLASKVYAYLDDNNKEHKTVKGINKCESLYGCITIK